MWAVVSVQLWVLRCSCALLGLEGHAVLDEGRDLSEELLGNRVGLGELLNRKAVDQRDQRSREILRGYRQRHTDRLVAPTYRGGDLLAQPCVALGVAHRDLGIAHGERGVLVEE